jgi:hypothetical protein
VTAESLAGIADGLPCGFHDAELNALSVDWEQRVAVVLGEAWVPDDGPREIYRPFRLSMSGLHKLALPNRPDLQNLGSRYEHVFADAPSCDGMPGWPPGQHAEEPASSDVPVYSFFVYSWNDFITIQTERATLTWLGPAYNRK